MRARAEWEKIRKERQVHDDEHAYQHHARWANDHNRAEDEKDFSARRDSTNRKKHFNQRFYTEESADERRGYKIYLSYFILLF
jgi:hypothetical protein